MNIQRYAISGLQIRRGDISRIAKEHNVKYQTLYARVHKGEDIESALASIKQSTRFKNSIKVKKTPTGRIKISRTTRRQIKAMAQKTGIKYTTLFRKVFHQGMTLEEASKVPVRWADIAQAHNMSVKTLYGRVHNRGMSLEQALSTPLGARSGRRKTKKVVMNDITAPLEGSVGLHTQLYKAGKISLYQLARMHSMNYDTLYWRIARSGMTVEQALTTPLRNTASRNTDSTYKIKVKDIKNGARKVRSSAKALDNEPKAALSRFFMSLARMFE